MWGMRQSGEPWRSAVLFLAPALVLAAIVAEVVEREPLHLDGLLVPGSGPLNFEPLAFFLGVVTVIGGGIGLLAVAAIPIGYLISRRRFAAAAFIPVALAGAWVINRALKTSVDRRRPEDLESPLPNGWKQALAAVIIVAILAAWPTRWRSVSLLAGGALACLAVIDVIVTKAIPLTHGFDSFPSGHAVGSATLVSASVALTWHTRWRRHVVVAGSMFVILVGVSRVYFGVHYASDIFGGWCIGIAWTVLLARSFRGRLRREAVPA
jgi:membrane-associated phospholipid phosphatase